ncbi:ATP-binding protein [Cupriavidus taiwanensis]|uniref:ATP-binding protein n=1 Tax=Cupriavidus taiwanensis TaxID=164546 RepID=A0A375BCH5_9BURK|nr:putative ATP-binding protein [Cupriavidus taiwanensis]
MSSEQRQLFDAQGTLSRTPNDAQAAVGGDGRQQWTERDLEEAQQQQFRLQQMQVMNWGTFNKLHVFDISGRGHLLVGPSGSGKSTVLDAHSALMAPPNSEFNAAARGNDKVSRDRTLVTYIRGAWATNESEEGLIAAQYLRPDTTLSAVAEVYANMLGQTLTLVGMWWIKGKSTLAKDVRHCFFVIERRFSLKELSFFMQADYNVRSFVQHLPEVPKLFDTHAGFRERFKARLGVDHDLALRLLHRTQSSKNLGDINVFMRENMLDEPQTFSIAKELCADFNTLAEAHGDVVEAREQQELLKKGRTQHDQYLQYHAQVNKIDHLLGQLEHHRDYLQYTLRGKQAERLRVTLEGSRQRAESLARKADDEDAELQRLRKRRHGMDDGNVAALQEQLRSKAKLLEQVQRTRTRVAGWLKVLGWTQPQDAQTFGERVGEAIRMRERGLAASDDTRETELLRTVFEADTRLGDLLADVRSLELRSSNLPRELVQVRDRIAEALDLAPALLPFGGELLDVPEDHRQWQGALERLLAPLTRSFLVPEPHYRGVVDWLEDNHTGQHVLYLRMREHHRRSEEHAQAPGRMLDTAPGDYGEWLRKELAQQYGNYVCAETTEAFRAADRALSLRGQIKRGGARHEKNDRANLNNRREWVIGFSNEQKKFELLEDIQSLQNEKEKAELALQTLQEKKARELEKLNAASELSQVVWDEIDEVSGASEMRRLEQAISDAEQLHPEVHTLDAQIKEQEKQVKSANAAHTAETLKQEEFAKQIAQLEEQRTGTSEAVRAPPADGGTLQSLFEEEGETSLTNLQVRYLGVRGKLKDDRNEADMGREQARNALEDVLRTFRREHEAAAADMGVTLVDWPDYARLLSKIEEDDLPRFEERFFRLLNEQSDRHLARLRQRIITEKDEIRGRMNIVNDALSQSEFNEKTYLRLENRPRSLPDVTAFLNELRSCLERNIKPDATREEREKQFDALNAIVRRLHSDKAEDERWKAQVLDVRQHVDFVAKEYDESGRVCDIYQSGAGKSGGQRQKLAATCLAAALRYQLAGTGRALPQFCTVLMDEAFDKADSEFTAMTLNIFNRFGFQMLMATPMKAVRTLEPFIGGAHVFSNKDRNNSGAVPIEYDMAHRRLVGLGARPTEGGDGINEGDSTGKRFHAGE